MNLEIAPTLADRIETIEEPIPDDTPEPPAEESEPPLAVHPLAAAFPMLEGEELDRLVDDIREHGLRSPIVLDPAGQLIAGRNRLAACRLAGVEPKFITIEDEPIAYIISENVNRRHLTKGQQAMAIAIAYPNATEKGGRGKTTVLNTGVSAEYVKHARFVRRHAPDLVAIVMAGNSSLNDAYAEASKQQREEEEYKRLRQDVLEYVDSAVIVLARLKSDIEKPETTFLGQGDFMRQVQSDVKQVNEIMKQLTDTI